MTLPEILSPYFSLVCTLFYICIYICIYLALTLNPLFPDPVRASKLLLSLLYLYLSLSYLYYFTLSKSSFSFTYLFLNKSTQKKHCYVPFPVCQEVKRCICHHMAETVVNCGLSVQQSCVFQKGSLFSWLIE